MRMSPSEAIMWAVEKDPALRSDFANVTILDRLPADDRMHATIQRVLVAIPRLGERVISPPLRMAPPEWRTDPTFELDYHLRRVAIPTPGDTRGLLDLAAAVTAPPLDRSRPLWEFTLVEGLDGDRAALIQRLHHAISDGVGAMRLSLSLVDLERDPVSESGVQSLIDDIGQREREVATDDPIDRDGPVDVIRDAIADRSRRTLDLARHVLGSTVTAAARPTELPGATRDAIEFVRSLRRQVLVTERGRSRLFATRSLARRYDSMRIEFDPLHRAAKAHGASVNDVFVTGVAHALASFHREFGEDPESLRMAMPVSTRDQGDATANRFAPTRVLVPTPAVGAADHLEAVHHSLHTIRAEPALDAADLLAAAAAGVPTAALVTLFRAQTRTIDFATSNLRGSPIDLFLGGGRIEASYPFGPRAGVPVNVTMMSYCGELHLGINSDPAAVIDPDRFLDLLRESFAELAALA